MKVLFEPITWRDGEKKRRKKVSMDNFEVPEYRDYDKIRVINYNVPQLKSICRFYKQRVSGNKDQLIFRIYNYLKFSYFANLVQRIYRGHLLRKLISLKGPAFKTRKCNNTRDFMTLEDLDKLPQTQFYSYKDKDGFVYGFDICSLYNLYKEKDCQKINPYTRNAFPEHTKKNLKKIIKLSHILRQNVSIDIEADSPEDKQVEFLTINLFQILDGFGHVTDIDWFLSLNRQRLIVFLRELYDIWNYRAQLIPETKRNICPPYGKPFGTEVIGALHNRTFDYLQMYSLSVMKNLLTLGEDIEMRKLGGIYVLGALTMVNNQAATAFPWLYQSFANNLQQ
tara:strand:- start:483 stop:1496 length:1014 start_codon:yes stop_codon:yes gene_type:complete